jgi:hypothetical protein
VSVSVSVSGAEAAVLKAVLCAGLYPHLARVRLPDKQYDELAGGAFERSVPARDIKFYTQQEQEQGEGKEQEQGAGEGEGEGEGFLHPSSALFGQGSLAYSVPWVVYSSKASHVS